MIKTDRRIDSSILWKTNKNKHTGDEDIVECWGLRFLLCNDQVCTLMSNKLLIRNRDSNNLDTSSFSNNLDQL